MRATRYAIAGGLLAGLQALWLLTPSSPPDTPASDREARAAVAPPPGLAAHPDGASARGRDPAGTAAARPGAGDGGPSVTARPGARPRVRGRVEDDAGRPIAGALVADLDADADAAGVRTDDDGRFTLEADTDPNRYAWRVAAVAGGRLATIQTVLASAADDVRIVLAPDRTHGTLELTLMDEDGAPVRAAHVWVFSTEHPDGPWPAWPASARDDPDAVTRRLRARLEAAADLADQEFEVAQGASGVAALAPDAAGRVRIAAILPGRYRVVAAARIVENGRPLPPGETLMISAYVTDGRTTGAGACADEVVDVAPPPAATAHRVVLRRARTFEGRVVVDTNPAWGVEEPHESHVVDVEGCVWARAEVESGSWSFAGERHVFSGRFRLEGLPRTPCRIRVWTRDSSAVPFVAADLPAAPDGAPETTEPVDVHVPDLRVLSGRIAWADGMLDTPTEVWLEGYAGTKRPASVTLRPENSSLATARYALVLDQPLVGRETWVARVAGTPPREFRGPLRATSPEDAKTFEQPIVLPAPRPAAAPDGPR